MKLIHKHIGLTIIISFTFFIGQSQFLHSGVAFAATHPGVQQGSLDDDYGPPTGMFDATTTNGQLNSTSANFVVGRGGRLECSLNRPFDTDKRCSPGTGSLPDTDSSGRKVVDYGFSDHNKADTVKAYIYAPIPANVGPANPLGQVTIDFSLDSIGICALGSDDSGGSSYFPVKAGNPVEPQDDRFNFERDPNSGFANNPLVGSAYHPTRELQRLKNAWAATYFHVALASISNNGVGVPQPLLSYNNQATYGFANGTLLTDAVLKNACNNIRFQRTTTYAAVSGKNGSSIVTLPDGSRYAEVLLTVTNTLPYTNPANPAQGVIYSKVSDPNSYNDIHLYNQFRITAGPNTMVSFYSGSTTGETSAALDSTTGGALFKHGDFIQLTDYRINFDNTTNPPHSDAPKPRRWDANVPISIPKAGTYNIIFADLDRGVWNKPPVAGGPGGGFVDGGIPGVAALLKTTCGANQFVQGSWALASTAISAYGEDGLRYKVWPVAFPGPGNYLLQINGISNQNNIGIMVPNDARPFVDQCPKSNAVNDFTPTCTQIGAVFRIQANYPVRPTDADNVATLLKVNVTFSGNGVSPPNTFTTGPVFNNYPSIYKDVPLAAGSGQNYTITTFAYGVNKSGVADGSNSAPPVSKQITCPTLPVSVSCTSSGMDSLEPNEPASGSIATIHFNNPNGPTSGTITVIPTNFSSSFTGLNGAYTLPSGLSQQTINIPAGIKLMENGSPSTFNVTATSFTSISLGPISGCEYTSKAKPYFQAFNGDVRTDGILNGFNNGIATRGEPSGSGAGSQIAALANLAIDGFVSASVGNPGVLTALTFANTGSGYAGNYNGAATMSSVLADFTAQPAVDFQGLPGANFGGKRIYKYSGNLFIGANQTLNFSGASSVANLPFFEVIVTGNLYIGPDVDQLDGIYVATGNIYTCAQSIGQYTAAQIRSQCQTKLRVNGSLIAGNSIKPERLGANGERVNTTLFSATTASLGSSKPVEVFNYTPAIWLGSPNNSTNPISNFYNFITAEPPIL